jgi:hypothetical protein
VAQKPIHEDCLRHCFERLVHAAIEVDLVIE